MKSKRLLIPLLICITLITSAVFASAQTDQIQVILDGEVLSFDQPPTIENGHTLVPLRSIFEALGADVKWEQSTRTATATKRRNIINIQINNEQIIRNGFISILETPPRLINSHTLVPIRAVAEAFNANVDWDNATRTVIINSNEDTYSETVAKILQGEKRNLQFGGLHWRVLDVAEGKALIITEDVLEQRAYDARDTGVTWETSDLRKYLNGEFLQTFTQEEQEKIIEMRIENPDKSVHGTQGGNSTDDKIFLLSLEEAERYFADDNDRIADYGRDGTVIWAYIELGWWLRTPGNESGSAISVSPNGSIDIDGGGVGGSAHEVRPALWLNLEL